MKVILFDMFGVIAKVQSADSRAVLEQTAEADSDRFWASYWSSRPAYDRGEVSATTYWKSVGEQLGAPFGDQQVTDLVAADLASWSEINQGSVDLVSSLARKNIKLGLLSNAPEEIATHYENSHRWLEHFSVVGFSCRIGSAKPERAAYEWCWRELGAAPEEILFVDDREGNVLAARELGMYGHVFTSVHALATQLESSHEGVQDDQPIT
ncbi:putative hydrolase of the HAD superfamily [Actinopolyspora biskrensis]|uniref:Putative hydrolase of the HAD superfamily n=1 Tax=Actinopolyspora biskrensis TaxID=1470178 RepID=A0A852Z4I2_9ACTN|nr:HAD family phosphatase [Actinopolyspora biskrensis]NYH77257.1 putative hydrolase of the HAD superfamily [Actinopolyspora biskrensis]